MHLLCYTQRSDDAGAGRWGQEGAAGQKHHVGSGGGRRRGGDHPQTTEAGGKAIPGWRTNLGLERGQAARAGPSTLARCSANRVGSVV